MSIRLLNRIASWVALLGFALILLFGAVSLAFALGIETSNEEKDIHPKEVLDKATELNKTILTEVALIREEKRQALLRIEEQKRKELEELRAFIREASNAELNSFDLRKKSNLSAEQIDFLIEGTGLAGLGHAYVEAEQMYGVNALALLGISAIESGWGTSRLAKERNNLFGFQAYDHDINKARYFETKEEGILHVARHLSEKYLSPDGAYFNGYTLDDVNVRYASDKKWSVKIASAMDGFVEKLDKEVNN